MLHFNVVQDYGGSHGIRDEPRLKSVEMSPQQEAFGKTQYPSLFQKAAVYLRNIIGDHPFVDGNKRTAVTVSAIFLARNGVLLAATPKNLEDFAVRVATDHLSIEDISCWLEENSKHIKN